MADDCPHESFHTAVLIGRLSDEEGGPITGYVADIQIRCVQCRLPFRFIGVPAGAHPFEPRVSIDGTQLRAPLEPATHQKFQLAASYTMPPRERH